MDLLDSQEVSSSLIWCQHNLTIGLSQFCRGAVAIWYGLYPKGGQQWSSWLRNAWWSPIKIKVWDHKIYINIYIYMVYPCLPNRSRTLLRFWPTGVYPFFLFLAAAYQKSTWEGKCSRGTHKVCPGCYLKELRTHLQCLRKWWYRVYRTPGTQQYTYICEQSLISLVVFGVTSGTGALPWFLCFQTNENLPWLHSLSFTTVYKQAACCARATKYPSFGMFWGLLKIYETVAQ